ncbi:MAG TPA: ATP-binding protein [Ktedonobacteraceae bacterium]|nr:ATP-binding protein [Ktedonobacteraceae bacterium]
MNKKLIELPLPPEGPQIEYKRTATRPEIFARNIASFVNTEGGTIIVGVDGDASIVGLTKEEIEKTQLALEKAQRLLSPRPTLTSHVEEIDGKSLLVIEVQKKSSPVMTENGRYYVRKGAASIIEEETLLNALAGAVPSAKPNILTSLGINVSDTVKVEEAAPFSKIVHERIEAEQNLKINESLSETIRLTREELFNERRERRLQARITFFAALITLILAILFVFIGIVLIYAGKLQAGVVTSVSSIISGIVSGLAFTFNKQANDRLDGTAKELVVLERTHTAMEYISYIKDVKVRDEALSDLAKNISAEKHG